MASPDVFLSSPSRAGRGRTHVTLSSSPDLPSLQEILSQRPKRPPLRTGSKAAPIPENATTTFTSAGSLWRSLQDTQDDVAKLGSAAQLTVQEAVEYPGVQASAVKTPPQNTPNPRKPGQRKKAAPEHSESTSGPRPCVNSTPTKDQPWKKFKSPGREISNNATEPTPVVGAAGPAKPESVPVRETETVSSHFFRSPEPQKPRKTNAPKEEVDKPLHLEPAMSRRMDWTPPAPRTQIILDSDTPESKEARCSQSDDAPVESFETMLASFKCEGTLQQETIAIPDEDSTFLKKRKLVELICTKATSAPNPAQPEKSPIKHKAPKKKPRTLTGLATAAYRPLTQPGPDPVAAMTPEFEAAKPAGPGKGKVKPRKRPSKAPKKKASPPKPILLSPGAALKLVAGQDFVFGTSSQLAREHSPSLLRDLQAAMKASNQLDGVEFVTPVNSDAIEPPENRLALWEAGARDADGDLFDVEVLNFADGSPRLPEPVAEADPFGYVQGANDPAALPELPPVNDVRDDDSFVNLSDILPAPGCGKPIEIVDDDSHLGSELCSATPPVNEKQHDGLQKKSEHGEKQAGDKIERAPVTSGPLSEAAAYELCSDAQLAKQVAQYGFKPIKKRTAMIALLEQCRQDSARVGQGSVRSASTLAATGASECTTKLSTKSASNSAQAVTAKVKRPRGRPRKSSTSEGGTRDLVPSAQPPESPKRPRGRPRKDAAASASGISKATQAKKPLCTETSQAPTTPKRNRKEARKIVVEIPDSESDVAADLSESACSSPDATFSPPQPVDLELSVGEDTELSLTMSPTDQQTALFTHITKAVTTAPRTTDPAEPSWHEKMLLYDPIVLEDLTLWLNTQLTRVGHDGEASIGDVKKWCESKSICCLGRVNLRGKERKRY